MFRLKATTGQPLFLFPNQNPIGGFGSILGYPVTISAGALSQLDEVHGGGSYLSQNDLRLHFGLGKNSVMSIVEISWPSGAKQTFHDLAADFIYTIDEARGIQSKQQFNQSACTNGG